MRPKWASFKEYNSQGKLSVAIVAWVSHSRRGHFGWHDTSSGVLSGDDAPPSTPAQVSRAGPNSHTQSLCESSVFPVLGRFGSGEMVAAPDSLVVV